MKNEHLGGRPGKSWVEARLVNGLWSAVKFINVRNPQNDIKKQDEAAEIEMFAINRQMELVHRNVLQPRFVRYYRDKGQVVVVMPLAVGDWHRHFFEKDQVNLKELMQAMQDVAMGLDYLAANGLAHGDVKASNLLIFRDRSCVADLGWRGEGVRPETTVENMPPEYFPKGANLVLAARGDQYSLASTYAMIRQRRPPFPVDDSLTPSERHEDLISKIICNEPELLLPDREAAVVRKALSRDRAARFESSRAFVDALTVEVGVELPCAEERKRTWTADGGSKFEEPAYGDFEFPSSFDPRKERAKAALTKSMAALVGASVCLLLVLIGALVMTVLQGRQAVPHPVAGVGPANDPPKKDVERKDKPAPFRVEAPPPRVQNPVPGPVASDVPTPIGAKNVPSSEVTPRVKEVQNIEPLIAAAPAEPAGEVKLGNRHTFGKGLWFAKHGTKDGINWNDNGSVELQKDGTLRMLLKKEGARWFSSEIVGPPTSGYGDYELVFACPTGLDCQAVVNFSVGYFYDDNRPQIGFDFAHWGDSLNESNGQFVVGEPSEKVCQTIMPFQAGGLKRVVAKFRWRPEEADGSCQDVSTGLGGAQELGTFRYQPKANDSPIPRPTGDAQPRPRVYLGLHEGKALQTREQQEVILESFTFLPWKGE